MDDQERQDQIRKLNIRLSEDREELLDQIDGIISQEREKIYRMDREEGAEGTLFDYPDEEARKSRIKGLNVALSGETKSPDERIDEIISEERRRVFEAGRSQSANDDGLEKTEGSE